MNQEFSQPVLTQNRAFAILTAALCGTVLSVSALFTISTGDGSYVLLGLFSAPISSLGYVLYLFEKPYVMLAFIGTPIISVIAGILALIPDKARRRIYLGGYLGIHYMGAIFVLLQTEPYGNWRKLQEQWGFTSCKLVIVFSLTVYLLAQIWLWRQLLRNVSPRGNHKGVGQEWRLDKE